jgi:hypothetical protein
MRTRQRLSRSDRCPVEPRGRRAHRGLRATLPWPRRPARRALCRTIPLALGLLLLPAAGLAAGSQTPKTRLECQKAFHSGAGRKRCFNQMPGANCAHPLRSFYDQALDHSGDSKDIPITIASLPGHPPAEVTLGVPVQPLIPQMSPEPPDYYKVSFTSDAAVVICGAHLLYGKVAWEQRRYPLHTEAHRIDAPVTVADYAPWAFSVVVEGRYASGESAPHPGHAL